MLGFRSSYSYVDTHARTHVVESALLIHVVQRSALLLVRVNSSIHIVRNRSVLCTQVRLAEQHVYEMQNNGSREQY